MKSNREKLIGIIVGCVAVCIVGFFVYSWVAGQFSRRRADIDRLSEDIKKFDRTGKLGAAASKKISQAEERSLPADPDVAHSHYQTWLVYEMEMAGMFEPTVRVSQTGSEKDLFIKQIYKIDVSAMLPQVVELLHAFYSTDWLHRITNLKLTPIKNSKWLDVSLTIETLSMRKAASDKLVTRPSNRLKLADYDAYYDAIVGRNFFGPRNIAPDIAVSGSQDVYLPRAVEITVKATDPDPYDQVFFKLVEAASPDAKIDPSTGQFSFMPKEEGKYEFIIEGTDDGFPAKKSKQVKLVINARPQNAPPPTAVFDYAKHTLLTALLDVDGQGEVWLHVRPTGQMVTLHRGDQFEIGSAKGTVSEIGEYDFSFDFEGKRKKLGKGELLGDAKSVGDVPAPTITTPVAAQTP